MPELEGWEPPLKMSRLWVQNWLRFEIPSGCLTMDLEPPLAGITVEIEEEEESLTPISGQL